MARGFIYLHLSIYLTIIWVLFGKSLTNACGKGIEKYHYHIISEAVAVNKICTKPENEISLTGFITTPKEGE